MGRNDGRITALDSSNGKRLWEFQTDGGVNAPASTFEHDGKQYLVVYAGGTSLAGSKRSDGVWLFALDGTWRRRPAASPTWHTAASSIRRLASRVTAATAQAAFTAHRSRRRRSISKRS